MTDARLDWNAIRPLNGSRGGGFEELCAQLARAESPAGARFERKGTPDAGVECYAVLSDKSEWCWQAKYFDALGDSQWSQLDSSIKTAIEKHPRLVRYFVCIPLDRPDARLAAKKSAKEKWDEQVEKWKKQATDKGMTVEFIYWGSHELLDRLARSEHIGRVRFWFDLRGFDAAWFNARLDEALRTAGPRYTPEIHIDLPIALEFDAFGRTDRFFDREKAHARTIRNELRNLGHSEGTGDAMVDCAVFAVSAKVQTVLTSLGAINEQPTGPLPFNAIAEQIHVAEKAAEELFILLDHRVRGIETKPEPMDVKPSGPSYNPFRDHRFRLFSLVSELRATRESLAHADCVAGSALMLLRGAAGTGKTHLLCDVARQRVAAGRPTVLLMGQQFVSSDVPWSQALQHLDLASISAEEFVGALEAAAQAAGARALLVIDALNEGAGRSIWPSHLEAFLAHPGRSPWIGVVLAIRSYYEEFLVPASVRSRASVVTHQGFAENEYDATKTFFIHYGLELPSTPLLAPEFRNPLFLKTLCQGLNAKGERRLPRGFHGITDIFDLYLASVNQRLAPILGVDRRIPLVRQALEAVARAILDSGKSWLILAKAGEVVNACLPGRDFERSLYRGLVAEGVLVEEAALRLDPAGEIVFVAYERFADHLAAKILLDRHLDASDPGSAFAQGSALAFICDEKIDISPGLLEAFCIQIPERTGQELTFVAPSCVERREMAAAFRESLIWRTYAAFSEGTREALNKMCRSEHDFGATLEVLLTVATLPEHPLNARFLDRRLRKDAMPVRDAWWSVYLHLAWGTRGAVDRLVDWASSLSPSTSIDEETVDLCAITLAWMLTSSNRFLRDRATQALVSLLTGRLTAAVRCVEQFADVDDPYVAERVFAVAYAVAMRCNDSIAVGALAEVVYGRVFALNSPPPHILLRDYARGVVERALYLGSPIEVIPDLIRPPYKSSWPNIPTEEDIKPLMPDWSKSKGSQDGGELEWGWNRIGSSVMDDDFARYVIGTNLSVTSSDWLSLRLDEPPWEPGGGLRHSDLDGPGAELERAHPPDLAAFEERRTRVVKIAVTVEQAERLEQIRAPKGKDYEARRPPQFDLRLIQRYVLKRVFELGWTKERFGHFDRFSIGNHGRQASKAERIGKKYQWIAYHEIMAFVADHFQYRERFREEEGNQAYDGPWQDRLRDIDPSCTMRSLRGGTFLDGHAAAAWWGPTLYEAWGDPYRPHDWILSCDDLPKVEELLNVTNPADGSRWLNGGAYFNWRQPPPADRDLTEVERREIWYICTGYLLRADDAQFFLEWAEEVDFWGRWMPEAAEVNRMFLGEHAWAPAARFFQQRYHGDDGWTEPNNDCPLTIRTVALEYLREASGLDCSVDEGYTLRLPVVNLITGLGIRWSGRGADFEDAGGQVITQDPTAYADGPSALLLREDRLRAFLAREKLTFCWVVLGEKRVLGPGVNGAHHAARMSGAYVLGDKGLVGFTKRLLDDPSAPETKLLSIVRSGT